MLEDRTRLRSWCYRDLRAALKSAHADLVSQKGSHRTYKHGDHRDLVTLVDKGKDTVPIGYVKDVAKLLRAIVEREDERP